MAPFLNSKLNINVSDSFLIKNHSGADVLLKLLVSLNVYTSNLIGILITNMPNNKVKRKIQTTWTEDDMQKVCSIAKEVYKHASLIIGQ